MLMNMLGAQTRFAFKYALVFRATQPPVSKPLLLWRLVSSLIEYALSTFINVLERKLLSAPTSVMKTLLYKHGL